MTETISRLSPPPDVAVYPPQKQEAEPLSQVGETLEPTSRLLASGVPSEPSRLDSTIVLSGPSFEEIFTRHETEIYRFALRLTRNPADADDLYQDVMLKAYRAFDRLPGDANHRAWLYRITWNTFLSEQRKRRHCVALDMRQHGGIPAAEVDHAAGLDACALLQEVAAFVDGLPAKQRLALVLRKYHGLDYDEIATMLDSSVGATRGNVHHALRKLVDHFADRL